jgi:2-desacetyl-2-hydroxyethyl bacteriochlorophyllide A dehydrogenase
MENRMMKALLTNKPHEFEVREVPVPWIGPHDVLLKTKYVGLCRSDIEIMQGVLPDQWVRYPIIHGHEWVGKVVSTGAKVTRFKPDDKVVSEGIIRCDQCENCKSGKTNLCLNYDQIGFSRAGGCAEFLVVPEHVVHLLSNQVDELNGALIEPASCVAHGVLRADPKPGEIIAIIGPGTLGLLALKIFKLFNPQKLIMIGINETRRDFSLKMGATDYINAENEDVVERVKELSNGRGPDIVFESAGHPLAVKQALQVAKVGGRVILEGNAGVNQSITLPSDIFQSKDLTVEGIFSYTSQVWSQVVNWVNHGELVLADIVTHQFPLQDFGQALNVMDDPNALVGKIVFTV